MSEDVLNPLIPPYVPYSTFSKFIDGLAEHPTLPSHIDKSLMSKMSGSGQSSLTAALKSLRLISDETEPRQILFDLVYAKPDEKKGFLSQIVKSSYPFLFESGFSISNTTSKQVEAKFREYASATGSTLTKCISFFLAIAKDAEISVSPHVKAPSLAKPSNGSKKKKAPPLVGDSIDPSNKDKDMDEPPKGMTKFDIPLKDTDNGIIYLPEGLTEAQAIKAVKMANFILRSYYEIDDEEQ